VRTEEIAQGFLAAPEEGTHPGVVLIHDVWGLGELYREFARRLASAGFVALAVDLYHGEPKIEDPGRFMRELDDPAILRELGAARERLSSDAAVGSKPVGVAGFCMGGGYALQAACGDLGFAACVAFYGLVSHAHGILHAPHGLDPRKKPRDVLAALPELGCPTLGIYGDRDEFVPQDDVRALEAGIARAGRGGAVERYAGCGHAFLNELRPAAYEPEAAADAWRKMLAFFRTHLGS
jgi:carboxymethylenebutenolidase